MNYHDFDPNECAGEILDLNLYDIPQTMRRNVKTCANLGASAVTVADTPYNAQGIEAALEAGKEHGIKIILKKIPNGDI